MTRYLFRISGGAGVVGALALIGSSPSARCETWSVTSPSGRISMQLILEADTHRLYYRVEHGTDGNRVAVIGRSPLGLQLTGQDFVEGLVFDSAKPVQAITADYQMPHGKRAHCRNRGIELTLAFRNANGRPLELDARAYDDGVAWRYRLPGDAASGPQTVEREATGFALPPDAKVWCAPSDRPTTYAPAYETYYEADLAPNTPSPLGKGWAFPLLFGSPDRRHWGLITEAGVDGTFCGARLGNNPSNGVYTIAWPDPAEGNGQGPVQPTSALPWTMPWRVIVIGNTPAAMVESTLVTDLGRPSQVERVDWIRPGRVAWSWWSDNPSPKDAAKQRKFIDLAAKMGWEYVLVDANWTIMDRGNLREVLDYAKTKGVGVLLWYNSGGPHNIVTEKPRDCLTYQPVRQFELKLLRDWGVKGIKVDFFQSDKQPVMALYQDLLKDAAEHQIMINFHGCTLPRGWERTYPHLMSMEAIRGEECYIFDSKYPERAPVQNTITPFTRNAVGPMDYTPVGLSDNKYPHLTTTAHELALTVVFESGWLHFADKPEAYLSLPPVPRRFLKEVPVAWDDTRFLAGYPGEYVILARRKGDTWWVAGVNGQSQPRHDDLALGDRLGLGRCELTLISDGPTPRRVESATRILDPGQRLALSMLPRGGFVAVAKPVGR